jgi:hypothetical protein
MSIEFALPLIWVANGGKLFSMSKANSALKSHSPELAGRPRNAK